MSIAVETRIMGRMDDKEAIAEIEAALVRDLAKLEQAYWRKAQLPDDIGRGLNVVAIGINLRVEISALSTRILRNKSLLVSAHEIPN